MFPCKPDRFVRSVMLAGQQVSMSLSSCSAAGATYALTHADIGDPAKVGEALSALRAAAVGNIDGQASAPSAFSVPGMTPHLLAQRMAIEGRKADGAVLHEQVGFFSKGTRVFQAAIVGEVLDREAVDTFFAGLRLPG